jgi:general secretion pathway protein J
MAVLHARGKAAGFTLVEMLLATSLIGFIMLMAYSGLDACIKLANSGEERIEASSRARISHEFLRKQLSRMLPLNFAKPGEVFRYFEGESDRIRWVGPMPGYLGKGGAYVQELSLSRNGREQALDFRFVMLNGYEDGDLELMEPIALVSGLASVEFAFKHVDNSGEVSDWKSTWDTTSNNQQLPLMVKIDWQTSADNPMRLPTLEVPTIVDANVLRPVARFANAAAR